MMTNIVTFNEKNIKGLSRREALLIGKLLSTNDKVLTVDTISKHLGCSRAIARSIAYRLAGKGWLERIGRNKYVLLPFGPPTALHEVELTLLFRPSYLSYWSALSFYGLTEHEPYKVFLATNRRPSVGEVEVLGVKVRLVYLSARKFFGFKEFKRGSVKGYVAEAEKAIADCLDKPRYCGGIEEVAKALHFGIKELDLSKLSDYARRMGRSVVKRLGYLMDFLGADSSVVRPVEGYAVLDPTKERKGHYSSKWGLLVNVDLAKTAEELRW